ncbi:MAG: hypothetical protein V3U93_10835, partial [Alphaproteobacteria bacterium]
MGTALEDIRVRLDRGLGRAPSDVPTLESLKARIDRGMGRSTRLPPLPRRRPEVNESQGLTRSALHGVVQGAAGGVAGFPEAVGIERQAVARGLLAQYDKIDRGGMPDREHQRMGGPAMFYLMGDAERRQRLRAEVMEAIRPIAEEPPYQLGQSIRGRTAEAFPVAPEHEGRFPVQLGRGVGSTATFLATGLAGRLLRLPALPVVAGTGAVANSAETFRDAIDRGASFEDAFTASRMAGVVGTSEAVPIVKMLDRLDDASGGQIRRMIVRAAQGGLEEGAQELFQSIAENLIASELVAYDPERGTFQGSGDAAGVGFTVGALFNALASMLGVKMRRSPQQVTEQTVREFTEHVVREPEGAPAPPGRPAERGQPFTRGQAPIAPGVSTGEPPAAPDAPVVVRPGEGFGGRPIPPGPEAPPATLPDDIPRTVFRGSGRTEQGEAYSGPAVPILGSGRYFAFSRKAAEKFGPEVEEAEFAPKNPLVIRSDEEWRALTKEAGWEFPNPFGLEEAQIRQQTDRLQEIARQRGHDAVVVIWDDTTQTDIDRLGNRVKTLRNVFGQPQALLFDEAPPTPATITAAPTPEGPIFPREEPGAVPPKPSRRVPRTPAALESLLSEWERLRFARGVTPERKAEAQRLQQDAINRLEGVKQQLQQAEQEGRTVEGPVEFRLRTASGAETTFQLEPDVEGIEGLQKRLAGTKAAEKFYSRAPGVQGMVETPTLDDLRQRVRAGVQRSAGAGAAYQGFVQDQVEGVAPAVPLRREDILRPLLKALNVPLYQGRIKSKKFLGFYRRHIEEVRIKRMNDIEVAAHEIGHLTDDRFPEVRRQWYPASNANKEIREELRGISYDKSKLFEGFAEFTRLWSTQREEAKARAPKFYGWFEDFLARNEHGPALRKAQEQMHQWFAQDAVSRARSKIGVTKEINAGLTRGWDRFRQAVADDLHGIYRMERELTGAISSTGPYEVARLTRAKHSIIEGTLLYGAPVVKPDGSHAFEGKGLSQILDPVAERLDDFLTYAVGRSAQELRSQGRERLFTGAEIKGMVALETP